MAGEVALVPNRPKGADRRHVYGILLCRTVVVDINAAMTTATTMGDDDACLNVADGTIAVGRCVYPHSHPSFFGEPGPVHRPMNMGTF